ncbi:hypothetical protein EDC04DRAFT_2890663 [Pisolithus marmoratus]|nr:hypothetical protein EDC04DRAFT_2890663 [Pisolithus marmoratus]
MFIPNNASLYHPSLEQLVPYSQAELLQHVVDTSEAEEEEEENLGGQEEDVEKDLECDAENGAPDLELESEGDQCPSSSSLNWTMQPEPSLLLFGSVLLLHMRLLQQNREIKRPSVFHFPPFSIITDECENFLRPNTPYGHLSVWFVTGKVSRTECGSSSDFMLMNDGEGLIMYLPSGQPLHILFSELEFSA